MKKFSLFFSNNDKEAISSGIFGNRKDAIRYFAAIKRLSLIKFMRLFKVYEK
jgi:hypothetical protein